jgi:hypothetical protein
MAYKSPHIGALRPFSDSADPPDEITVTDPRHPLFGRRFPIISSPASFGVGSRICVAYEGGAILKLAVTATNLSLVSHNLPVAKLTLEAIRELIRLATEGERPCPLDPAMSGAASPQTSAASSSMTSPRSCRR